MLQASGQAGVALIRHVGSAVAHREAAYGHTWVASQMVSMTM